MRFRQAVIVLAACGLAGSFAKSPAQTQTAAQATTAGGVNSIAFAPEVRSSSIWTPARLGRATAMPLPVVDADKVASIVRARTTDQQDGPSGATPPFLEAGPPVSAVAPNVHAMPLSYAGKLNFTTAKGDDMWCSAQFIAKNLVLTAAHCLQDDHDGSWHQNILFDLQYERGQYSRRFGARCMAALTSWVGQSEDHWLYDFGIIMTDADSDAGYFGTMWNWGRLHNRATKIGYPGGVEDGEVMQVLNGPLAVRDGIVELRHGNRAKPGGSSGGGLIAQYSPTFSQQANHIISVTSFSQDSRPGVTFGPYFTESFKVLFDYAGRGCR